MNRIQHLSRNATLNSVELMDVVSGNIFGYTRNGHRARRWKFNDFMNGGEIRDGGYKMSQGKAEPRPGEWTKMMIKEEDSSLLMIQNIMKLFILDSETSTWMVLVI